AKQYLKDGRALRVETVINDAYDIGCQRLLPNLDDVQAKARAINQRLLDTERVGQGAVLASPAFERIAQATVTDDGRRAPAIQFAIFYTKVHDRVLRPLLATCDQPHAPPELRAALRTIDQTVDQRLTHAQLRTAA